jgi:hypothetical protein
MGASVSFKSYLSSDRIRLDKGESMACGRRRGARISTKAGEEAEMASFGTVLCFVTVKLIRNLKERQERREWGY